MTVRAQFDECVGFDAFAQGERSVDRRMGDDPAGYGLYVFSASPSARRVHRASARHRNGSRARRQSPAGSQGCRPGYRRPERRAARPAGRSPRPSGVERFCHRTEGVAMAERHHHREPHRAPERRIIEAEQQHGGHGRADDAAGPGDVPAAIVVLRRDRDADPQLRFAAERECGQCGLPAGYRLLGECDEHAMQAAPGWMTVARCVSSKSSTCAAKPAASATKCASTRSPRPGSVCRRRPAEQVAVPTIASTPGWCAAPIAKPSTFTSARFASCASGAGSAVRAARRADGECAGDAGRPIRFRSNCAYFVFNLVAGLEHALRVVVKQRMRVIGTDLPVLQACAYRAQPRESTSSCCVSRLKRYW